MLNLRQHLTESSSYETLKLVQGDRIRITTQLLNEEGGGEGGSVKAYLEKNID